MNRRDTSGSFGALFHDRASRYGSVSRSLFYAGDRPLRHSSALPPPLPDRLNPVEDSRGTRDVRVWRMRTGISLAVSAEDRLRLLALIKDRNAPQKHVWRGQIVLLTADGVGTNEIMRRTGKSKTCVWRWQERFAEEGFEGLGRDKTRPSRVKPLADEIVARVVALTLDPPPGERTHWTGALMAKASGVSVSSVQRIWRKHDLQPHRVRQFNPRIKSGGSNDPRFIEKLRDVVGLYVDPPAHAVVLSVDEKSQIQALDRTQPGLPLKKGRAGTMTHDYVRNGTTTLFAAMNILDGTVIGQNMQRCACEGSSAGPSRSSSQEDEPWRIVV